MSPGDYIELVRADILSSGSLSASTRETIRATALDEGPCEKPGRACIDAMYGTVTVSEESKRAAMAELWLQHALSLKAPKSNWANKAAANTSAEPLDAQTLARLDAWMGVARESYAYLFFTERTAGQRSFVDRQIQIRDYYNLAVQETSVLIFDAVSHGAKMEQIDAVHTVVRLGRWTFHVRTSNANSDLENWNVHELIPASSMAFKGRLRRFHRRDGVGAELVAVKEEAIHDTQSLNSNSAPDETAPRSKNWSEMPTPAMSALLRFSGRNLSEVLVDEAPELSIYDPYKVEVVEVHGQQVPLAANFTAAYGLWLARANFSRQALESLFGGKSSIDRPHLFLMQPYDPNRRVILMIHGLASSPEAWVNVANEMMRDDDIRSEFQIWQMYYPTSMPIPLSHNAARGILAEVLSAFDPSGKARASNGMVLVGHSMGGVISRLMVSSSGENVWDRWIVNHKLSNDLVQRLQPKLSPLMHFDPVPQVERVVFIATPHRGTEIASTRLGRWIAQWVQLPESAAQDAIYLRQINSYGPSTDDKKARPLMVNSLDNLDKNDPFMKAAFELPISPTVRYHSIIARREMDGKLEDSDDGLVPYWSSHLAGSRSEKIIQSGHSVQEEPPAIAELRRILHEDMRDYSAKH